MSGVKGRSGGKRKGAGAKSKGTLTQLHELVGARLTNADWDEIFTSLVAKAKRGNVSAFRELRGCRFGQLPVATDPIELPEDERPHIIMLDCNRRHVDDEEPDNPPVPPGPPPKGRPPVTFP